MPNARHAVPKLCNIISQKLQYPWSPVIRGVKFCNSKRISQRTNIIPQLSDFKVRAIVKTSVPNAASNGSCSRGCDRADNEVSISPTTAAHQHHHRPQGYYLFEILKPSVKY